MSRGRVNVRGDLMRALRWARNDAIHEFIRDSEDNHRRDTEKIWHLYCCHPRESGKDGLFFMPALASSLRPLRPGGKTVIPVLALCIQPGHRNPATQCYYLQACRPGCTCQMPSGQVISTVNKGLKLSVGLCCLYTVGLNRCFSATMSDDHHIRNL